jgi:NAD(P)-dependent dehydrogenase (short-subunit alcohol dehydrogenase family)
LKFIRAQSAFYFLLIKIMNKEKSNQVVTVFGAYGHTGRFVVAELQRRGFSLVLAGRDAEKLESIGQDFPGADVRPASIDDPGALDRALSGAAAVINCAGPFAETAAPVIEAALRAKIPYTDVAAEVEAVVDTFGQFGARAREAGIAIVPAMAFYGGLGDLLATAAVGDWAGADEISLAYALDSWKPTRGTRRSGETSKRRRDGRRLVFSNNRLELRTDAAPVRSWTFPAPVGAQEVVGEFTTADSVTIPSHLKTAGLNTFMTLAPLKDLADPDAVLTASDESGRSSQTFLVETVARRGNDERRAVASGRDIYAITAPLVVEATARLINGSNWPAGVFAPGEIFDAGDFLRALSPEFLSVEIS